MSEGLQTSTCASVTYGPLCVQWCTNTSNCLNMFLQ